MTALGPAEKLAELCDADRRTTNPSTRAVATAITAPGAGTSMPDPYGDRDRQRAFLDQARELLGQQPSAKAVRSTGRQLIVALSSLVEEVAKQCQ